MKRLFSLLAFIMLFHGWASSTHIVGGELTCKHVSGNTFQLKLIIYRDCLTGLAAFDQTIKIGIFDRVTHALVDSVETTLDTFVVVKPSGLGCVTPPEVCVEAGYYIEDIILNDNPNGYYIVWERCCRNHSVVNILDPGAAGMTFYLEVPDPAMQNSSPEFGAPPLPFLCENNPFTYNFTAFDSDGDSLVYTMIPPSSGNAGNGQAGNNPPVLTSPLPAPYPPIFWANGYDLSNIAGGVPITINSSNGIVSGTPDYLGLYAMAVKIDEYRNGIRIGQVRREIEFVVLLCNSNQAPQFSNNVKDTTYTVYPGDSLCFAFTVTDLNQDSLYVSVTGDVFAGGTLLPPYAVTMPDSGSTQLNLGFCWYPECHQVSSQPYQVVYRAVDDGCPLPKTSIARLKINVSYPPDVNTVNLLCLQLISNDEVKIHFGDITPMYRYFQYRQVYRSVNGGPFIATDIITNPNLREYIDNDALNNGVNDYCYFMTGFNNCGIESSSSDTLCSNSAKNDIDNYVASVSVPSNDRVLVRWASHPDYIYSDLYLFKKENNATVPFQLLKKLTNSHDTEYLDFDVKPSEKSYCYAIYNEDVCGNLSPISPDACTILLSGKAEPFTNYLSWNEYINWVGGLDGYEIFRRRSNESQFKIVNTAQEAKDRFGDANLDLDAGSFVYYIRAKEKAGLMEFSRSNEITLEQEPLLFLPNAFTPNDDGINDEWGAISAFVKDVKLNVYDRYGAEVFSTTTISSRWDGKINNKEAAQGVYVYTLEFTGFNSKEIVQKTGRVAIVR